MDSSSIFSDTNNVHVYSAVKKELSVSVVVSIYP